MNRQLDAQYSDGIAKAARAKIGLFRPMPIRSCLNSYVMRGHLGCPQNRDSKGTRQIRCHGSKLNQPAS
jgi:hypothetical protein